MGKRRPASYEISDGLLTPPSSPSKPNSSLGGSDDYLRAYTTLQSISRTSIHGGEDCLFTPLRKSENAPPNVDGFRDTLSGFEQQFHLPFGQQASRKLQKCSNPQLLRLSVTHLLLHDRAPNVSCAAQAFPDSSSDLIDLSTPDIESLDGEYQTEHKSEKIIPIEVAPSPAIGCNDASSSRSLCVHTESAFNRRLRPSQRAPSNSRKQVYDRFISPRKHTSAARDIIQTGKSPSMLTDRQRQLRRRSGISDPFGPPRVRSRVVYASQSSNAQRLARIMPLHFAGVLGVRQNTPSNTHRQPSIGGVWNVGGPTFAANMNTRVVEGESNAPTYSSNFLSTPSPGEDLLLYEQRLALAFDIDQANRVLGSPSDSNAATISTLPPMSVFVDKREKANLNIRRTIWKDNEWLREGACIVLEAPDLRDDFYCSVLAYSPTIHRLAVGLGSKAYLWSQSTGVAPVPRELEYSQMRASYITSLAFSSVQGGRAILAIGRGDGRVAMYSPIDKDPRFLRMSLPTAAAHVCFRPTVTRRSSQRHSAFTAENEVFMVGDEAGFVSVFFVEWPHEKERFLFGWHAGVVLHARIAVHSQQICGIAWSPDGEYFATGGNDNLCSLFQSNRVFAGERRTTQPPIQIHHDDKGGVFLDVVSRQYTDLVIGLRNVKHQWRINAAVKAIAFCPWQRGLLAAGGGSNDRCIHFYHTISGACLARIDCAAQVTSLIWSTTRREIVATFGFAQPDHPYRIAVYSWPSCQQVVAIPWNDEMRALYAIPYPNGPAGRRSCDGGSCWSRTAEEGCIVVAASDGSIKFHEIWCEAKRAVGPHHGLLGGSDILESLHGIDKDGVDTIR